MEAKSLLEHLERYPPQPFSDGCAKVALRPFLRTLQLIGAYHEHGYYANDNGPGKLGSSCLNVVGSQRDGLQDFMVYTAPKRVPAIFASNLTAVDAQDQLFIKRDNASSILHSSTITIDENDKNLRRRERAHNTATASVIDSLLSLRKESSNANNIDTVNQPVLGASFASSNSILVRCGIVDEHVTRNMILSLGYDVPGSSLGADECSSKVRSSRSFRSCLKCIWSDRTYSLVCLLLHWANFLRCGMFINHESHVAPMTALIPILWLFMVAACNTTMFVCCFRRDCFYTFFRKWASLFQDPTTRALGLRGVLNSKFVYISVVVQWAIIATNVSCVVFLMVMDDDFSAGMNYVFYVTGYRSTTSIAVSAVSTFFTSASWIGSISFIVIVCHHVETHFREFRQVLQLHIAAAGPEFPKSLTLLRERYLAMCDNVGVLDRHIRVIIVISYSVFITLACLNLYQVVKVKMDESVMAITAFWLVCSLGLTAVSAYSTANVSVAMHAVGDDLFAIQTRQMTLDQFGQLQMFLSKANGPNMGFTVLGLVVVTRELMLTLFGVYLTYGIVLLQLP